MAKNSLTIFIKIITFASILGLSLLTIRVVDLQGFRGAFFRQISEANRQFRLELPAERGVFLDRFGQPLVINVRDYVRLTDPLKLYSPVEPISANEALLAQINDPLSVNYNLQREYLRPLSMAHTLGYVSPVTAEDLAADNSLGLTDMVGRLGLEKQFDDVLRGRDGYQEFEINAMGEKQAVQLEQPPKPGASVETTLDPYLSTVALRALGDKTGAVVIIDADTGEALSIVSTPGFNSNLFTIQNGQNDQERQTTLQLALTDERQLFFNRVVSGQYPPGSVFKLVVAAAGLDGGAFDLDTTVDDQGILDVGEYHFANWYYTQYGRVEGEISLVRAITRSNDTFFYKAAEWTGVDAIVQKAKNFGLGSATGIEIPGEKTGLVPDPAWKEKTFGERWFLGNTYHLGIGQGDLLVTPLQLARMIGVFGNGGKLCQLSVVSAGNRTETNLCGSLGLQESTLAAIQEGMVGVCSAGGTAFPLFDWNTKELEKLPEGISAAEKISHGVAACKTGTAEFGGENELGHRRTHGWFGMVVGGLDELLKPELTNLSESNIASDSATVIDENTVDLTDQHQQWLSQVKKSGFPNTLAILVLVESDENQPFMEGSTDAAPVARSILDWLISQSSIN